LFSVGPVDAKAAAVVHDSRYSPGENQIIKLLSAYISSGCKGRFQESILNSTFIISFKVL